MKVVGEEEGGELGSVGGKDCVGEASAAMKVSSARRLVWRAIRAALEAV